MANPELPQEIVLEIFSRIPAKSVGKCRTLSKSWNTHLSTPHFIKKHLITRKQTIQQEHVAFSTQYHDICIITSPTKSDEEVIYDVNDVPHECRSFIGSCNGLILYYGRYHHDHLILLNPITLKRVYVKAPHTRCTWDVYGFGYDSCSDDYKIVQLRYSPTLQWTNLGVYSFKNGVWKTADDGCYPFGRLVTSKYSNEGGAFVNGALHWLMICREESYRSCIAAFDLANEVFSEIPLPKDFVRDCNTSETYGVSVVGGCLVIVDNFGNGVTEVWIMKEYGMAESWVKFRIGAEHVLVGYKWDKIVATLCYVEDGELLCLRSWDLFACDLKGETERKVYLGECGIFFDSGIAFVDSLVFPEVSP